MSDTPYRRGFNDAQGHGPVPAYPNADASWAERLYHWGWQDGRDALTRAAAPAVGSPA